MGALADLYDLEEELGRGGMGVVWRARERATGRLVALKLVHAALDPELALRLRREAELLAALRHPGIPTIHAAGDDEGRPWLATELVEGARPLDRAWASLDRAARVALVRDAGRALGHAHARGVVHRDVKAANVLVGKDGAARVVDFGVALARGAERLTQTGAIIGTAHAMAPEQVQADRGAVGPPADVWALGALLYEALTDRRPFLGRTLVELGVQILEVDPPAPRTLDPTISPALEAVALRALRRAPGERFADGEAFAAALEAASRAPRAASAGLPGALLVAVALLGLLALVAITRPPAVVPPARPASPATGPTPAPVASVSATPDGPDEDAVTARSEWARVRAASPELQGAQARSFVARFRDHPLAARARALARSRPVFVIPVSGPGHGLFGDSTTLVVVHGDAAAPGQVAVDGWRLGADGLPVGTQEFEHYAGRLQGRPAMLRPRGSLPCGLALGLARGGGRFVVPVLQAYIGEAQVPAGPLPPPTPAPVAPRRTTPLPALPEEPRALRWTADGRLLAVCDDSPVVYGLAQDLWSDVAVVSTSSVVRDACDVNGLLVIGHGDTSLVPPTVEARRGDGSIAWSLRAPAQPDRLAGSPDGAWLAIGTGDGHVVLLDLRHPGLAGRAEGSPGARLLGGELGGRLDDVVAHGGRIIGLAFTPDSRRLVSVGCGAAGTGAPGDLRVWEVASGAELGEPRALLGEGTALGDVDVAPDGRHALVGRMGAVEVWELD